MELVYNANIDSQSFGFCDISFTEGNTLQSAVLMSLLCYRRVRREETEGNIKHGWWADSNLGSRLWLLKRRKILPGIELTISNYIEEALMWMVTDGLCASYDVKVEVEGRERIDIGVTINRHDKNTQYIKLENLWDMI